MARQPLDAPDPAALMNEMGASTASRIRGSGPLLAAILLLGSQMVAGSEGPGRVQAANGGRLVWAPDGVRQAEEIGLSAGLAPALLALEAEESIRVADWPVAPGVRADVLFTRRDIYAPDARILRVDGSGTTEIPRSSLVFLFGKLAYPDDGRAVVSVDPASGEVWGLTFSGGDVHQLSPPEPGTSRYLLAAATAFRPLGEPPPEWMCGQEEAPPAWPVPSARPRGTGLSIQANPNPPTLGATLAIDTDNEFMSLKFGDNTTNAANYIAQLVASVTTIYERDLLVRVSQGTTILRVSSIPDPYAQNSGGNASGSELVEFGNYWNANYGGVSRTVATLLSGKQPSSNSASGIAWLTSLCSKSYGYSFCKVFKISYLVGDTLIVAHEIGHNFGSPHTHCYAPPVDNCYAGQAGCYAGATSCPSPFTISTAGGVAVTGVTGTLMSYCHLLGGCEPDAAKELVFHPRSLTEYINAAVSSATGSCILPLGPAPSPTIGGVAPNFGPVAGGTGVSITGTNFASGATVTLGGAAATSVSVVNPSLITAVTTAHAAGTVDVVVTNPGPQAVTLAKSVTVLVPPASPGSPAPVGFYTLSPCRLVDTRNTAGAFGGPALAASSTRLFPVTLSGCGVPPDAKAISVNLTVTGSAAAGYLTVYPASLAAAPLASSLNFKAGGTRANNAVLALGSDGSGAVKVLNGSAGAVHLIVDVNGYFR